MPRQLICLQRALYRQLCQWDCFEDQAMLLRIARLNPVNTLPMIGDASFEMHYTSLAIGERTRMNSSLLTSSRVQRQVTGAGTRTPSPSASATALYLVVLIGLVLVRSRFHAGQTYK
jgi:hypothetical protein